MILNGTLGFLGYGNMGSAILEGLLAQGIIEPRMAIAFDPSEARMEAARAAGISLAESAEALAQTSDILMLAVKPQSMEEALRPVAAALPADALVISIAAGLSIAKLKGWLGSARRIVRVMPNTPALVQAGAAGIALSPDCTEADETVAHCIFGAVGMAVTVDENDIDAVTALSGSGPAYFFYMAECLAKAGEAQGLSPDISARLAAQTLVGAGKLLGTGGEAPSILRERVTSKGGTTEAALNCMRAEGFSERVQSAVEAAAARSRELGR